METKANLWGFREHTLSSPMSTPRRRRRSFAWRLLSTLVQSEFGMVRVEGEG